jgi:site-specific recombinase
MIMVFGVIMFTFCTWAVFSKKFCDGIITKHLLTFSAITSALAVIDPSNYRAFLTGFFLFISGMAYWLWNKDKFIHGDK